MMSKEQFKDLRKKSRTNMEAYDDFLNAKDELELCKETCKRFMREASREGHYTEWKHWKGELEKYESYWK